MMVNLKIFHGDKSITIFYTKLMYLAESTVIDIIVKSVDKIVD